MIKDFFVSFKDNFKEKTKNPFLGTYLLVWLIRNWELVFTLFNFDKEKKLQDKIDFIKNYYSQNDFIKNLSINVLWSFAILIITYFLLNLSRFIINISENQITPWIYKITDSKSIVLKSTYEALRSDRDDLQVRLDSERESKSRLENRIKVLDANIIEITTQKQNQITEVEQQVKKSSLGDSDILFQKLIERNQLDEFTEIAIRINKGEYISNDYKPKDYFIQLGLIKFEKDHFAGHSKYYSITKDGENILRKQRLTK